MMHQELQGLLSGGSGGGAGKGGRSGIGSVAALKKRRQELTSAIADAAKESEGAFKRCSVTLGLCNGQVRHAHRCFRCG